MMLRTQKFPFYCHSFLEAIVIVDIVLVVCITKAPFYARVSPFQCTFHIIIGDIDQNINLTMLHSPVFKLLLVPNFLQNKSPALYLIINGNPFNM